MSAVTLEKQVYETLTEMDFTYRSWQLQDAMTETKPFYDPVGTMGNLRKVTVRGLDHESFFAQLRGFLKPETELLLVIGPPHHMCTVVADMDQS